MNSKSVLGCVLGLLAMLLAGCDRPTQISLEDKASIEDAESGKKAEPLRVTLLPEVPRSGGLLTAVVKGALGPFVYTWELNGELVAGENKARLSLTGLVRGDVVRVVVADGETEASAETVVINSPPKVESVVVKTPLLCRGVDFEVEAQARDVDGDPVEFRYVWRVNGRELFFQTGPVLPGDSYEKGDIVKLTVIPRDQEEEGEPFDKGLEFEVANAPPRFITSPPENFISAGYSYQARAVDADEDEVRYLLAKGPDGMTIDPEKGLVRWTVPADERGTHEVRIEARDADGMIGWQEYTLKIERSE
jgi:hypothetical protein